MVLIAPKYIYSKNYPNLPNTSLLYLAHLTLSQFKGRKLVLRLLAGIVVRDILHERIRPNNIAEGNVNPLFTMIDSVKGGNQIDHHVDSEVSESLLPNPAQIR